MPDKGRTFYFFFFEMPFHCFNVVAFLLLLNWVQAWLILRIKASGENSTCFLSKTIFDRKRLAIFLGILLSVWSVTLGLLAYVRHLEGQNEELTTGWLILTYTLPYLLLVMELGTVIGYLVVFHYLFKELKKVLTQQRYQSIKYRTATYLALISILISARFFYYGTTSLTLAIIDDNVDFQIHCKSMIASYLTELLFCIFVIFHLF